MPIYEYECKHCGKFEVLQKITEKPLKACEKCGRRVHRLVSLSSFALVGGGWGKDLYSSVKPGSSSSTDLEPKSVKSESKPAKPESKPETKPVKPEAKPESKKSAAPAAA
jgi:putative FmdB family regulatory protein